MFTSTFRGGIHPPQMKITAGVPFENLSIPHLCRIPMQQHTGKPAIPVVEKDQFVKEGELIGKADGLFSANVHASIPGRITDIGFYPTPYSEKGLCVVIEAEGSFSSDSFSEKKDISSFSAEEIKEKVASAGIVGMGGAAFPTFVKLNPPSDKKIDTLIINAAECEPYLAVDDMLCRNYAEEIIAGCTLLMKSVSVEKCVIGIENNKKQAYKALQNAVSSDKRISVKKMKTKYPQGSEKQLIETLTGRQVPSGKLPMDAGVIVQNVGTAFAVYQAVCFGKPLIERYITITGSIVKKPGNYKIKIGSLITDIIEECGGLTEEPAKILLGGPMCGFALPSADYPVIKGTNGVLFLSKKEAGNDKFDPCIRCGNCVHICPCGLMPYELGNAVEKGKTDFYQSLNPLDCMLCGSCAYVCPSKRPLTHFIKIAQQYVRSKK